MGIYSDIYMTVYDPDPVPLLGDLALSNSSFSENAAENTVVGNITGATAGSTLTIVNFTEQFKIVGSQLQIGGTPTPASASPLELTIRETLAGSLNSPNDNTFTITVTAN